MFRSVGAGAYGGGMRTTTHRKERLAERYARGELSGEQYRERLDELQRHSREVRSNG